MTPQPTSDKLVWQHIAAALVGAPVATIAWSRSDWEGIGAEFFDGEDQAGGVTRIATGRVSSGPFGVLDHDDDVTFVVADQGIAEAVLDDLHAAGLPVTALLEVLPDPGPPSLDERVDALESTLSRIYEVAAGIAPSEFSRADGPQRIELVSGGVIVEIWPKDAAKAIREANRVLGAALDVHQKSGQMTLTGLSRRRSGDDPARRRSSPT